MIECPLGAELANANYPDTVFDVQNGAVLEMNARLFNGKETSGSGMTVNDRAKEVTKFTKTGEGEIKFNKPCSVNGTFEVLGGTVTIAKGATFASSVNMNVLNGSVVNLADGAVLDCPVMQDAEVLTQNLLRAADIRVDASQYLVGFSRQDVAEFNNIGTSAGKFKTLTDVGGGHFQVEMTGANDYDTDYGHWSDANKTSYIGDKPYNGKNRLLSWGTRLAAFDGYQNQTQQLTVFAVMSSNGDKFDPIMFTKKNAPARVDALSGTFNVGYTGGTLRIQCGVNQCCEFSGEQLPTNKGTPVLLSVTRDGTVSTAKVYCHDTKEEAVVTKNDIAAENFDIDYVVLGTMLGADGKIVSNNGGRIGEVIVFSRALSEHERAYVEKYLKEKWFNSSATLPEVMDVNVAEGTAVYEGNAEIVKHGVGTLALGGTVRGLEVQSGGVELKNQTCASRAAIWMDAGDVKTVDINEQNRVTGIKNKGFAGGEFVQNTRAASTLDGGWGQPGLPKWTESGINGRGVLEFVGEQALVLNSYTNTSMRDLHVYAVVKTTGYRDGGTSYSKNSAMFSFASDTLAYTDYDSRSDGVLVMDVGESPNALVLRVGKGYSSSSAGRDGVRELDTSPFQEAQEGTKAGEPYLTVVHNTYAHTMFAQVLASDETIAVDYKLGPRHDSFNVYASTAANVMSPFNVNLVQLGGGLADHGAAANSGNAYHRRMWFGQMGEFIAFDKELSREEESELISYLRKKWFNKGGGSAVAPSFLSGKTLNPSISANADVKLGEGTTIESDIAKQTIASLEAADGVEWVRNAPTVALSGFGFFTVTGDAVINGSQSLVFSPEPGTSVDLIAANALGGTAVWTARIAGRTDAGSYSVNANERSVRLVHNAGTVIILR